nr:MAG TPA: hypothetical protein [Caudoviricetes sp.]
MVQDRLGRAFPTVSTNGGLDVVVRRIFPKRQLSRMIGDPGFTAVPIDLICPSHICALVSKDAGCRPFKNPALIPCTAPYRARDRWQLIGGQAVLFHP